MTRSLTTISPNSSSAIIEVPSSAGFSAGDLVYYNGSTGDYGPIPATAVSSASWGGNSTNTATSMANGLFGGQSTTANPLGTRAGSMLGRFAAALIAAYPTATGTSGANTIVVSSATSIANGQVVSGLGIAAGATVTNIAGTTITLSANNTANVSGNITFYTGNIVQAFSDSSNNNTFYYQIVSFAQASVVTPTQISASYPNVSGGLGGVLALTGGGFVVYWLPSSTIYPVYAIYNNAGTVVTAATQDSGTGVQSGGSYLVIHGTALQNGGFALTYSSSTWNTAYLRTYGATGTATYSWITLTGFSTLYNSFDIAARSDNSVCIAGTGNTSNTWQYAIYNSSGTAIVAATTFTSTVGSSTPYGVSVCCMLNDTFVIGYLSSGNTLFYGLRLLPTGNTLGSEIATTAFPSIQSSISGNKITLTALANNGAGGFIVQTVAASSSSVMMYAVYNASGISLSGTSGSSALVKQLNSTGVVTTAGGPSALELPSLGVINLYCPGEGLVQFTYYQSLNQISTTTYNPVNIYNTQQNVGSATGTPTAYGPAGSYPGGASFYTTANTYGSPSTSTWGTVLRGPTTIRSAGSYGCLSCTTFPNGNFAVAYVGTGSIVFINLYSPTSTLLTSFNTGISMGSVSYNYTRVKITALTSGKMALVWGAQSSQLWYILLYGISGTTFTQIGTTTTVVSYSNSYNYNFALASLTNDRFVISWSYGTTDHRWAVYDNTNTQVATATWTAVNSTGCHTVTGNPSGGFGLSSWVNTTNQQVATYINTNANTFSQVGSTTTYNPSGAMVGVANGNAVCAGGQMYFPLGYTAPQAYTTSVSAANGTPNLVNPAPGVASGTLTYAIFALGVTGQEQLFGIAATGQAYLYSIDGNGNASNWPTLTTAASIYSNGIYVCTCPSYGPYANIVYCDGNGYPTLATINPSKYSMEYISVTSTSPSVAVPIYPIATTTTSPAITGTVFVGVAVSSAPAGGSGQVQISGTAQLNTNYSSTTAASSFDFTGQAIQGVKGTSIGKTVIITGNT